MKWLKDALRKLGAWFARVWRAIPFSDLSKKISWKWVAIAAAIVVFFFVALAWLWSREPNPFDVREAARAQAGERAEDTVGVVTTAALIRVTDTLLNKWGGYVSNDITPPGLFMDNMPNWEFGALVQVRDMARAMRNDISRSRSQSVENSDLAEAEPLFNFHNDSWIFPSTESQYRQGIAALTRYRDALADPARGDAQFFARADNLSDWLAVVEKRLGSLSQRLSASVGQVRVNTDLAGDPGAAQSTQTPKVSVVKTPWLQVDDVFYEARGATWALRHFMQAIEVDFADILEKKNAGALVSQIIRELDGSQRPVWSPLILNGSGFGLFANHSLVMASYVSRANAAVIDLRDLLSQG